MKEGQVYRLIRAAWPLLKRSQPEERLSGAPPLSVPRVRALFQLHPELLQLRLEGHRVLALRSMECLFHSGAVEDDVTRACGLTLFQVRTLLKGRPDLRQLADQNHLRRTLEQMSPVFDLVERDGHTIWSACRAMGIRGGQAVYRVAQSDLARERYPRLMASGGRK